MKTYTQMVEIHGKDIGNGETCSADHIIQNFTLTIRTLNGVSVDTVKNLIETKYEVIDIQQNRAVVFVRGSSIPDFT
jgi:hypothetical protein